MKDDDPLLTRLGEALRSRREREGELSLEARAEGGPSGAPPDPPGDEARPLDVFAPLSERVRASIVERSLRGLAEGPAAPPAPAGTVSLRPRRRRPPGSALGALVALAAALWLLWPSPRLPPYTLTIEGGDSALRSAGGEGQGGAGRPIAVTAGSHLELVLRPATPIDGAVEARLYLVASPGAPPIVTGRSAEVAPGGSVRWRGAVRDLVGERTGEVELLLVVSRDPAHPDAAELGPGRADRGRGWQSFRTRVRVINER
jgi:hypothetical protein